jgi:hypothetical protein
MFPRKKYPADRYFWFLQEFHRRTVNLSDRCLAYMNAQEAQTLLLHETVVWIPDGMKGEVIAKDGLGLKIRWEDGQFGYYQFTDLLSQIERAPGFDALP